MAKSLLMPLNEKGRLTKRVKIAPSTLIYITGWMRMLFFSEKGTEGEPDVCPHTWTVNHEISFGYVVFKAYLSYPGRGTG